MRKKSRFVVRAVNGARTRDPQLGKLVLYQLSYYRKFATALEQEWSRYPDSNRGPTHYECVALPTEPYRLAPTSFSNAIAKVEKIF